MVSCRDAVRAEACLLHTSQKHHGSRAAAQQHSSTAAEQQVPWNACCTLFHAHILSGTHAVCLVYLIALVSHCRTGATGRTPLAPPGPSPTSGSWPIACTPVFVPCIRASSSTNLSIHPIHSPSPTSHYLLIVSANQLAASLAGSVVVPGPIARQKGTSGRIPIHSMPTP